MTTPHEHDNREVVLRGDEITPVLATIPSEKETAGVPVVSWMAVIEGVLTLRNSKGCFEVGGYILVAPFGSYAIGHH